jgi:adenosine kinase
MELGKQAASNNKVLVLNLSAPFIPQFFKDPVDQSAPYWDYILGNETEAVAYAESHGLETKEPKEIAKYLANLPKENTERPRVAIITQGTEPTLIAVQGQDEVKEIPVHAIEASKINDTNGAGDAFAGGFLAGLVQGESLERCVDMGQWLASLSIQELGPSYASLPFLPQYSSIILISHLGSQQPSRCTSLPKSLLSSRKNTQMARSRLKFKATVR